MILSRIQRRLLLFFLALLIAAFAPAAILLERQVGSDTKEQIRLSLTREAEILASEMVRSTPADLSTWVREIRNSAVARITIIGTSGEVLGDTDVPAKELTRLENHAQRPEVAAALAGLHGAEVRRSTTLDRKMMYVAVPVGAPPKAVIRLALPLDQVAQAVNRAQRAVWVAALWALIVALGLGLLLSRWLSRPVVAMTEAARAMTTGNFDVELPTPTKDELGDLTRALATLRTQLLADVTESKRVEAMRRDFVANASHELRTPVAAIAGVAETLAAGAADDPAARSSFIAILQRHAERLTQLISDLLDIARLEAGYVPRVEAVLLATAVDSVTEALRSRAEQKNIQFKRDLELGVKVNAEPAAVVQILTNLVENAIKYVPAGGLVTLRAKTEGARVLLCIEDNDPGISEKDLPRLFERFYRVDSARSRALGGTGLGLSIVRHLALANNGDVGVESEVGHGSRFYVSLPAC